MNSSVNPASVVVIIYKEIWNSTVGEHLIYHYTIPLGTCKEGKEDTESNGQIRCGGYKDDATIGHLPGVLS